MRAAAAAGGLRGELGQPPQRLRCAARGREEEVSAARAPAAGQRSGSHCEGARHAHSHHTHTHTHPQSSAHPFPTAQDSAEQDSLDLCRKMRPDSELYLAVQAAHAQRCAWATMEAEAEEEETAAASGQKPAADDAVDETTAAAAEASTAAATDILAMGSSPSHCNSARDSDSGDSSNVVFAQLVQLYDDAAAGLPDQSIGSAAAAATEAAVGELHSAPGPTPAPAASSSLLPEGGGGGGGLFSRGRPPDSAIAAAAAAAAVSSSYSRPVPPKQPGAIGSSTARLSRIQIAAGHSLGSGPGPGAGAASSLKSDTVSGAAVVDKASATLRSSAYVYSTPEKSREQVQHACVALPYCALIICLLSCLPAGRQQLVAFPGHLLALAQSLAGCEALTDGEAG